MTADFKRKLFKTHLARISFDTAAAFSSALLKGAFYLGVVSLCEAFFPLDYVTRMLVLLAAFVNFAREFIIAARKLFTRAVFKTCLASGEKTLAAWELYSSREKLVSLGISDELIKDEITEGHRELDNFKLTRVLSFNRAALLLFIFIAILIIFNRPQALRVFYPRKQSIDEFMKIEMPDIAVKGESWEAKIKAAPAVTPSVYVRQRQMSQRDLWRKCKPLMRGQDYYFRIDDCFAPFSIKFGWKNIRSKVYSVKLLARPEIASLTLNLQFPEYLKLPPQKTSYGTLSAFEGTSVGATIEATEPLRSASISDVSGGEEVKTKMTVSGSSARGSFEVRGAGFWFAELLAENGLSSTEAVHWEIEITRDSPPQAEMISPESDLIITDSFRGLAVKWWAGDDFGVSVVYFCRQKNTGKTEKTKLFEGYSKEESGKYDWKLSEALKPDDSVSFWIQARDAGGRSGESAHLSVTLKDFLLSHEKSVKNEKAVKDEIFRQYMAQARLAVERDGLNSQDLMERQSEIEKNVSRLADKTGALVSQMEKDPLYNSFYTSEYAGIERHLQDIARSSRDAVGSFEKNALAEGFQKQDETLGALERLSVLSEELFKRSSMDNLQNLGRNAAEIAENLDDLLQERPDAAKLKELTELTERIDEMMRQIASAVRDMPKDLPEEFVNSDAMKNLDFASVSDSLENMKQALSSGNLDEALKKAKDLLNSLKKMQKALMDASLDVPALSGGAGASAEEERTLQKIVEEEENIAAATGKVTDKRKLLTAAANAEKSRLLDEKAAAVKSKAENLWMNRRGEFGKDAGALSGGLYEFYKSANVGFGRFINKEFDFEPDIKKSLEEIEKMKELSVSTETVKKLDGLENEMKEFYRVYSDTSSPGLDPQDRYFLTEISTMQKKTAEKTDALAQKLYEYSRKSAQFPQDIIGNIKKARGEMQNALDALLSFNPESAASSEEKALYYLKKSMDGMNSFSFMPMPGGSSGGGMMPSMMPAGGLPQMPGASGSSGASGFRQQSFEIPQAREKSFNEFLKTLNEARKTPLPEKYKDMLKDYYDRLSR